MGDDERLVIGVLDLATGSVHSITDHVTYDDPMSFVRVNPPTTEVLP